MKKFIFQKSKKTAKISVLFFAFLSFNFILAYNQIDFEKVIISDYDNSVKLIYDTNDSLILEYSIGEFFKRQVSINNDIYYHIYLQNEGLIKEIGKPELSKIIRSISIPGNAKMKYEIIYSEFVELKLPVAPSKGELSKQVDPSQIPYTFSDQYNKDAYFPENLVELGEPYLIRKNRGIKVTANPFSYNPERTTLKIFTKLQILILPHGIDNKNSISDNITEYNKEFEPILRNHFINYKSSDDNGFNKKSITESGKMLIITIDSFFNEINVLKDFNNSIGLTTDIVKLGDLAEPTAYRVRSYIQHKYDSCSTLTFVLLVGDSPGMPVAYYYCPDAEYGIWQNWAADPRYALVSGGDSYPDILVGRFPAETKNQVRQMVNRTIYYKSSIYNDDWVHKGIGIASNWNVLGDDNEYDWEHLRNIRDSLLNYHYTEVDEFYDGTQGGQDSTGNPSHQMVTNAINNGRSIINYTGHGVVYAWYTATFTNTHVNNLNNINKLPFIFSSTCLVGQFDYPDYPCFAETWLKAESSLNFPVGGIGFYGSSRVNEWKPPMEAQDAFNAYLTSEEYNTYGALCYSSSIKMMEEYGDTFLDRGTWCALTWNLFGDPSVNVIPHNIQSCETDLIITDEINGGNYSYRANSSISASTKIKGHAIIHLGAKDSITLSPGFEIEEGCSLEIDNNGCN